MNFSAKMLRDDALLGKVIVVTGGGSGLGKAMTKYFMELGAKVAITSRDLEKEIRERIAPFTDVPILFISATEKVRIFQALEAALSVYENRTKKIKTSELNDTLLPIIENMPPPAHRGKYIKIKYITQLPTRNPSFVFFCNHPTHIKDSYRNFLENQMRKHFQFTGVPIHILFRQK